MVSNIFESQECSCLTETPKWLEDFKDNSLCELLKRQKKYTVGSSSIECPIPLDYGMSCKNHDLTTKTECKGNGTRSIPEHCYLNWCIVDKDKCFSSNVTMYEDLSIRGLYYSYDICPNDIDSEYLKEWVAEKFAEKTSWKNMHDLYGYEVDIVIPEYTYPYYFEKNPEYNFTEYEYTNLQGAFIDFYDQIRRKAHLGHINYKLTSGGSRSRMPNMSNYNRAISDVQNNLADLAAGGFWTTSERMKNVTFSLPLYSSPIYVYELRKSSGNAIIQAFYKTLRPFDLHLWLAMLICIIMAGLANVCTSRKRGHQEWHRIIDAERNGTLSKRAISRLRVAIDSFVRSFLQYTGQGSEIVERATISQKLIIFGFGFFILVVCSTYTANLATFLTMNVFDNYITDVEDQIVGSDLKVCVPDVLVPFLKPRFKGIEKNFEKIIPKADFDFVREGIGYLKDGTCDLMFSDEINLKIINNDTDREFTCNSGLVSIKTLVIELEWSVPVRSEYAQSLNSAIYNQDYGEEEFADILNTYEISLGCEIYLESGATGNFQIRSEDMALPITILLMCFVIGILSKIFERRKRNRSDDDKYLDNHMNSMDSVDMMDMMEYKYRLELIMLNTQMLLNNVTQSMDQKYGEPKID